jgi:hypothetical protein
MCLPGTKVNVFCALSKERVYGPFSFMEMTITSIAYLDMPQQFLLPQLVDAREGRIHFQHFHPLTTLEKHAGTSTPTSQVSGLVERRQ